MRIEEAQAAPVPVAMVQPPGRRQVGQHGLLVGEPIRLEWP